jgi:predicted deacylase
MFDSQAQSFTIRGINQLEHEAKMHLRKYTFKSEHKGYNVLFLGAVHGNEHCGSKAIFKIVEKFAAHALTPLKGSVSFIPVCNPKAFEKDVRFIEENLNRIIRHYDTPQTYEQELATELNEHIAAADVIIDLHSTLCPVAKPFMFSDYPDTLADQIAAAQNIQYIITGWPEIYAQSSDIQDLSTGNCAHVHHKTCLTVECGHHYSDSSEQTAYYVIMNTLLNLGMLEGYPSAPVKQKHIHMDMMFLKEKEGRLAKDFNHLDFVKAGDILAFYDDGTKLVSPSDSYVLLPKATAPLNSEWFYLGNLAHKAES